MDTSYYFACSDTNEEFTLHLRNEILEVRQGKLPHNVGIITDRGKFNTLFTVAEVPSIATLGKATGNELDIKHFDDTLDFTFYPIRVGVQ